MTITKLDISLRPTEISDLEFLFQFQLDEQGRYLAAFMPNDSADKAAYIAKHTRLLNDPKINNQTILIDSQIIGSIATFEMDGNREITYWIDRNFWRKGLATKALQVFLVTEPTRPIVGRVAYDNFSSQKVLEKCGFVRTGSDKGFASARQKVIDEFIYKLSN